MRPLQRITFPIPIAPRLKPLILLPPFRTNPTCKKASTVAVILHIPGPCNRYAGFLGSLHGQLPRRRNFALAPRSCWPALKVHDIAQLHTNNSMLNGTSESGERLHELKYAGSRYTSLSVWQVLRVRDAYLQLQSFQSAMSR